MASENVKEVKAPEEKTEKAVDSGLVEVKLSKLLDYNGKMYDSIHLDLEGLTGRDSMEVEAELMQRKKGPVLYGPMNNDYLIGIAAKACQEPIGADAFLAMKLKDFNKIKNLVQNFLLK